MGLRRALALLWLLGWCAWAQPTATPRPLEANASGGEFRVTVQAERDRFELGQTQRVVYRISGPAEGEVEFPEAAKLSLKPFEVSDAAATSLPAQGNRRTWEFRVKLVAYETGDLTLPATELAVKSRLNGSAEKLKTPSLMFHVERVLAKAEDKPDQVRDLKPLHTQGVPAVVLLGALLVVLLLALIGYLLVRWWKRPRRVKAEPPLAPYPRALRDLQVLRQQGLEGEQFYDQLSHILRSYLGWRFQMPLLEQTTSETLRSLAWTEEPYRRLKELLETADLIKFAQSPLTVEQAERHLDWAEKLIMENPPHVVETRA